MSLVILGSIVAALAIFYLFVICTALVEGLMGTPSSADIDTVTKLPNNVAVTTENPKASDPRNKYDKKYTNEPYSLSGDFLWLAAALYYFFLLFLLEIPYQKITLDLLGAVVVTSIIKSLALFIFVQPDKAHSLNKAMIKGALFGFITPIFPFLNFTFALTSTLNILIDSIGAGLLAFLSGKNKLDYKN